MTLIPAQEVVNRRDDPECGYIGVHRAGSFEKCCRDRGTRNRSKNLAADSGAQALGNQRDANNAADHAEPFDQIDETVAAVEHVQVHHGVLSPRREEQLYGVKCRIEADVVIGHPLRYARHVVRHGVPGVWSAGDGCDSD